MGSMRELLRRIARRIAPGPVAALDTVPQHAQALEGLAEEIVTLRAELAALRTEVTGLSASLGRQQDDLDLLRRDQRRYVELYAVVRGLEDGSAVTAGS